MVFADITIGLYSVNTNGRSLDYIEPCPQKPRSNCPITYIQVIYNIAVILLLNIIDIEAKELLFYGFFYNN